jgi:hypothetical protein
MNTIIGIELIRVKIWSKSVNHPMLKLIEVIATVVYIKERK